MKRGRSWLSPNILSASNRGCNVTRYLTPTKRFFGHERLYPQTLSPKTQFLSCFLSAAGHSNERSSYYGAFCTIVKDMRKSVLQTSVLTSSGQHYHLGVTLDKMDEVLLHKLRKREASKEKRQQN